MLYFSFSDGENGPAAIAHVKAALRVSKEINVSDKIDVKRAKANGLLKKARSAFKKADMQGGEDYLGKAEKAFIDLKRTCAIAAGPFSPFSTDFMPTAI
jgi:hypothetical protein